MDVFVLLASRSLLFTLLTVVPCGIDGLVCMLLCARQ